ncbi:MAG: UDP-N-acetylmuramate dehydrogenase, partial [Spirochaetales bacterium]|nr:UDP-N-acetylmuramate dehydrogenase [Spirochaetales bacterium]
MNNLGESLAKINLEGRVLPGEPLGPLTTFGVGGPADALVYPASFEDIRRVRIFCQKEGVPLFVMGRGANLLIADNGIRGVTLNLTSLNKLRIDGELLVAQAGLEVSQAIDFCSKKSLSSLEFLYGMPSSIGGAVWMNARCYGHEISDVFAHARVLNEHQEFAEIPFRDGEWDYKVSPFQKHDWIILEAGFRTETKVAKEILDVMSKNLEDRTQKGHFRLPCAGSIFKNDRRWGEPSGVLIERCGLKGLRKGRAVVSNWHANIIVNEGGALAS